MALVVGTVTGVVCGGQAFGVLGSIVGGVIGLVVGHVVGKLPDVLSTKWLLRKLWRSSNDELWRIVNLRFWNFAQTFALLTLAGRNQDIRTQLPRVIDMLEADDQLTRVYGWDALRLVFDNEANAMGEYDPRASTGACRLKVADLRQRMAERCQPGAPPNGGPTTQLGSSGVMEGPSSVS